jgi:hypothetical protein
VYVRKEWRVVEPFSPSTPCRRRAINALPVNALVVFAPVSATVMLVNTGSAAVALSVVIGFNSPALSGVSTCARIYAGEFVVA